MCLGPGLFPYLDNILSAYIIVINVSIYYLYKIELQQVFKIGWPNEIYHLPPGINHPYETAIKTKIDAFFWTVRSFFIAWVFLRGVFFKTPRKNTTGCSLSENQIGRNIASGRHITERYIASRGRTCCHETSCEDESQLNYDATWLFCRSYKPRIVLKQCASSSTAYNWRFPADN